MVAKSTIPWLIFLLFWCHGLSELQSKEQSSFPTLPPSEHNKSSNSILEKMIPGLDVSKINWLTLSAAFAGVALKREVAGTHGIGIAVVHIHPKHLALLLQFNGELASNTDYITKQPFLDTFTRFFVAFGGSSGEEINYRSMEKLLNSVSQYNLKQKPAGFFTSSKKLQLWISIPATKNIENVLHTVLEILKNTNTVKSKTVITLLLNYRSLHFTAESAPMIREDISLAKILIKNTIGKALKTGIVLEIHNCKTFLDSPLSLTFNLTREDKVVFLSQLYSARKDIGVVSPLVPCFMSGLFVPLHVSLQVDSKIVISLENSTFTITSANDESLEVYSDFSAMFNKANLFFKVEISELSRHDKVENATENKKIDATWLNQKTVFDQTHFGVTVYPPDKMETFQNVIPKVSKSFLKIIVENQGSNQDAQLKHFVQSMAQYRATMVRNAMSKGEINQDEIPAQLLVASKINLKSTSQAHNSIKEAFEAAYAANEQYPGLASVMFALDTCRVDASGHMKDKPNTFYGVPIVDQKSTARFKNLAQAFGNFRKEIGSSEKEYLPKIGVISEYCHDLVHVVIASIFRSSHEPSQKLDFHSDLFLLKIPVRKNDILEYGAKRTASSIIYASRNCDTFLILMKKVRKFNLYVQLTGCNDKDNGDINHTDIYELTQVVQFWEFLNSWAVKENKTIFMGTSFEYPKVLATRHYKNSGCVTTSSASCGWWMTRDNISKTTSLNGSILWEDRKSIALKLYEEFNAVPKNNSFDHRKTNSGDQHKTLIIAILTPSSLLIGIIVAITVYIVVRHRSGSHVLSRKEISHFVRGHSAPSQENGQVVDAGSATADRQPYNKTKYEIGRSSFQIDSTRCLGSGEFATVMCGNIKRENKRVQIAVKMIKKRASDRSTHGYHLALKGLLSEIKILSYVGEHKNVVKMEGACTANMKSGKLFVFLELCELGSLHKYLRGYNPSVVEGQEGMEMRELTLSTEMSADLRRWCIEIASGMEFLSSKKVVHADLATRNILLDPSKCAKISDFGLSRRLYDYSEYLKEEAGPLPWRWMAPESLTKMIFNEKTDVWAFGITLWEMYSLGDEPYPGLAWSANFSTFLERGLRLNEPRFNQDDIYSLMRGCWEAAPSSRPTFAKLRVTLQDNVYVDVL